MKKILLVEDDPEIVMLLHINFCTPEYNLTVCSQGHKAIERAFHEYFDLIIVDLALPDMDGIEVCSILTGKNLNRPILALVPVTQPLKQSKALAAGAADVEVKPFSTHALQEKVEAIINRASWIDMLQAGCEGKEDISSMRRSFRQILSGLPAPENN